MFEYAASAPMMPRSGPRRIEFTICACRSLAVFPSQSGSDRVELIMVKGPSTYRSHEFTVFGREASLSVSRQLISVTDAASSA